jgi:hypothetical protein
MKSSFHSRTLASNSFIRSRTFNSQLTGSPSLLSLPCKAQLTCQPSTNWIAPIVFLITTLNVRNRKHCFQQSLYCHRCMLTDPLPRHGLNQSCSVVAYVYVAGVTQQQPLFTESLLSNRSIHHNINTVNKSFKSEN